MSGAAGAQRREVFYRGRVQGVGFRYTARSIARRYDVTGFVRNLADGRVQLVAEGAADEVERFLKDVQQTMDRYIADVQVRVGRPTSEFNDFSIRF